MSQTWSESCLYRERSPLSEESSDGQGNPQRASWLPIDQSRATLCREVSEAKRLKALEEENGKLKRLLADAMLGNAGLKELIAKMVTPAARREPSLSSVRSWRYASGGRAR
jgi:hypothetical protein